VTEPIFKPRELEWTLAKIARFWDEQSADPIHAASYFSSYAGKAIAARIDKAIGLRGRRVLDFGSGRGDLLAHLFRLGAPAMGLEFSERSAEVVKDRFAAEPLFRGVNVADALPSPLCDASFDAVFLVEVLEHLLDEQLEPTLDEVSRLLVPGGHVVATTPNDEHLAAEAIRCPDCGARFHRWQHLRSFTPASISDLFAQFGFEVLSVEATDWNPSRLARLRRVVGRGGRLPHLLYMGLKPLGRPSSSSSH
jgi:2-polyprenyl-3-methyl-5-hydroxy-6-metoxy-1,4-benzoquinol methylase